MLRDRVERQLTSLLLNMRAEVACLEFRMAAMRLRRQLERHYRPDQPRAPKGTREGGQWIFAGSGQDAVALVAQSVDAITKHGIDQIIQRGISPIAILDAIKNPLKVRRRGNGTTQYIGRDATVVLNDYGGLVTIWPQ